MGDSMAERMDAGWQAARHWETECEAARAERNALSAELAALKKRVADAPRRRLRADSIGAPQRAEWFALVRLEDGE